MKVVLALALCFLIGVGCRLLAIPLPAPQALIGALLVLAMTTGYVAMDRYRPRRIGHHRKHCAGADVPLPGSDKEAPP